jgi:hypothetical protein
VKLREPMQRRTREGLLGLPRAPTWIFMIRGCHVKIKLICSRN